MNPTLSWERVGSSFYRTFEGYNLEWAVKLGENHVRVSAAGGVVAVWPRSEVIRQGAAPAAEISLYSGLGRLLLRIPFDIASILNAGFTSNEEFVVVVRSGHLRRYYDFSGNFTLSKVGEPLGAQFGSVAVVELADQFAFVGENVRFWAKPASLEGWALIGEDIVFFGKNGVWMLDSDGPRQLSRDPVEGVVPSPCGTMLAVTGAGGATRVMSADMARVIATVGSSGPPIWVGSDAVLKVRSGAEEVEATVYNLGGGTSSIFYDLGTVFHSEVDGVRILSDDKAHNLFCKVPQVTSDIFRLGSNAASSVLVSCIDMLEQSSPRANENLGLIEDLGAAIRDCCEAATYEVDPRVQKRLLRAANFGKSSLELHDSSEYLEALDTIRIANTVRDAKVGLFCTVAQLRRLVGTRSGPQAGGAQGPGALVSLLEKRKIWDTALGLAKLLRMPVESVPIAWACDFIQGSQLEDEALRAALDERLSRYTGLSYSEIGRKAYDEGRIELALALVAREPNTRRRIELLMEMGEHQMALEQSVRSEHTDLVYYVLFVLQKKLSLPQFYRVFCENDVAVGCYQRMLEGTPAKLHEFNYQMDRRQDDFRVLLAENLGAAEPTLVSGLAKQTRGYFGRALEEYSRLLLLQAQLGREHETDFKGLTVAATISKLLGMGQVQRAQKVKSSFGVPEAQFWHARIQSYVERRDWDGLWQFGQQHKSPVGYTAFYEACKAAGNLEAASQYVDLSSASAQQRVQKFIELGYRERAVEAAKGDAGLLAAAAAAGDNNNSLGQ